MDPLTASSMITAGANTVNSVAGLIGQRQREKRAMSNQKELMDLQQQNQMELNKQGQQIQLDTWNKTSYPSQVAKMKEAGLNVGLMYGMGGGGGTTTGSQGGGSAQGGSAPAPQPMNLGNMVEAIKAGAEIALIASEKAKKEAEKKNIEAGTVKTGAETTNIEANTALTQVKTDIEKINMANRQYQIDTELNNVIQKTNELKIKNQLTTDQYESLVTEAKQNAIGATLRNKLTETQTKATEAQINEIQTKIYAKYRELAQTDKSLEQQDTRIKIETFQKQLEAEYPGMWNVFGSVLKKGYNSLEEAERTIYQMMGKDMTTNPDLIK
ncbi:MAG: DNA pilot protein [Microviridae sp.]|nr:MAG: DNA pilot protein [Microviridae sp.]